MDQARRCCALHALLRVLETSLWRKGNINRSPLSLARRSRVLPMTKRCLPLRFALAQAIESADSSHHLMAHEEKDINSGSCNDVIANTPRSALFALFALFALWRSCCSKIEPAPLIGRKFERASNLAITNAHRLKMPATLTILWFDRFDAHQNRNHSECSLVGLPRPRRRAISTATAIS